MTASSADVVQSLRQHTKAFVYFGKFGQTRPMQLRVRSIIYLAEAIHGFELVDPRGRDLPRFAAGAHIDLRAGGFLRQYSLWNDPAERRRYCIAVLREDEGRGGSRHLHEAARVGDLVEVSLPRNNFPLAAAAERHLLIAGGIGIAPIMSMIAELQRRQADFQLHYCTCERRFVKRWRRSSATAGCVSITTAVTRHAASTSRQRWSIPARERISIIAVRRC
jgi:ferredoxin-NADP reductase